METSDASKSSYWSKRLEWCSYVNAALCLLSVIGYLAAANITSLIVFLFVPFIFYIPIGLAVTAILSVVSVIAWLVNRGRQGALIPMKINALAAAAFVCGVALLASGLLLPLTA